MELTRLLSKFVLHNNFIIFQVSKDKNGFLFTYRDRFPSNMRSFLVYRYSVRVAHMSTSLTTCILHNRVCENIEKSHRIGFPLASPKQSNVRLHAEDCRVSAEESDLRILSACKLSQENLLFLESSYICKIKPSKMIFKKRIKC